MTGPTFDACRLCGGASPLAFEQTLLARRVRYYDCPSCGYLQTEHPYWLAEAYKSAINDVDTGIMWRNLLNRRRVIMTLLCLGKLSGKVVDHAGGYGILVRLLRDSGIDARWRDKYCPNLLARGFEATAMTFDLLTAFEVLEHLEYPTQELGTAMNEASAILVSTELIVGKANPPPDWWYLGPEHGQHIGFFRRQTLEWLATHLGLFLISDGRSLHLFSKKPINEKRWLFLQKLNRLAPCVARIGSKSLMMQDFEMLRQQAMKGQRD